MSSLPTPPPIGIDKALDTAQRIDAQELGVVAGLVFRNFINGETINVLPVSYSELRRVTQQDGQARGLLRMLTMPIVNAKWDVLSIDEDQQVTKGNAKPNEAAGTTSSKERDLIFQNLFSTEADGGMSTPFHDVVAIMALALRDGFKQFEKVFKLNDQGRIVLQKLAYRENDTVSLLSDDHGDYDGFRQRVHFSGRYIDVTLPKDKSLLYTFGKEESPLYGSPLFLPVYYHMDKKHKLYYISHIAYQMLAIPPRVGTVPSGTDPKTKAKFLNDLAGLGFNAAMVKPFGFEVEGFESSRSLADMMPLIDHHNTMATKAVLGQFMDLSRSSTGRLAGEQQDIFVMGIVGILKDIEKLFNNWVIPQLVDFNFKTKSYPKLRARAFTDADQEALHAVFKEIMTAASTHTSPEFNIKLEQKVAGLLNINDINYDAVEVEQVAIAKEAQKNAAKGPQGPGSGGNSNTDPTQHGKAGSADSKYGKEGNN